MRSMDVWRNFDVGVSAVKNSVMDKDLLGVAPLSSRICTGVNCIVKSKCKV
jgi:hypothetical protein